MDSTTDFTPESPRISDRDTLLNNLTDLDIHCSDLRVEIGRLLKKYRAALRMRRHARARLNHHDFIASVAEQFGPEMADTVRQMSRAA